MFIHAVLFSSSHHLSIIVQRGGEIEHSPPWMCVLSEFLQKGCCLPVLFFAVTALFLLSTTLHTPHHTTILVSDYGLHFHFSTSVIITFFFHCPGMYLTTPYVSLSCWIFSFSCISIKRSSLLSASVQSILSRISFLFFFWCTVLDYTVYLTLSLHFALFFIDCITLESCMFYISFSFKVGKSQCLTYFAEILQSFFWLAILPDYPLKSSLQWSLFYSQRCFCSKHKLCGKSTCSHSFSSLSQCIIICALLYYKERKYQHFSFPSVWRGDFQILHSCSLPCENRDTLYFFQIHNPKCLP